MSTEDQDKLTADIEQGEKWLAKVMGRYSVPESGSLGNLKHRIRIAVHEEALQLPDTPEPAAATLERLKQVVRAELGTPPAAVRPEPSLRGGWWWRNRLTLAGLAAAAAVALAVIPSYWATPPAAPNGLGAGISLLAEVLASASSDDFEQDLVRLQCEVDELTDLLLPPDETGSDTDLEELEDEVDRLLSESEPALDV